MATKPILNRQFLRLKKKLHSLKAELYFLKHCKKENIFPNFIKICCKVKNTRTESVIQESKKKWLNLERQHIHKKLSETEIQLYNLHLKITKHLNNGDHVNWLNQLNKINEITEAHSNKKKQTLNKKFKHLLNTKIDTYKFPKVKLVSDYVKNLSTESFTEQELNFLNKGLNFTIKPQKPKIEDTVIHIETALKYLPEHIKTNIRKETSAILNKVNHTHSVNGINKYRNSSSQYNIIKSLKQKNVHYMKADKGNALVILDKEDYNKRMQETITSCRFRKLKKTPLPKMVKTATQAIKKINEIFGIPKRKLIISNPSVPRLYGLPKIHKDGNKMRPIVGNINAPSYNIAKWLVSEFNKYTPPDGCSIKNSFEFVEKIKHIKPKDDEILVSFDIVSLYPNVPIPEALVVVNNWIQQLSIPENKQDLYLELAEMCMDQNELQYNNEFYKLTHGTSMGNPLSCFISNAFIGHLESRLKQAKKLPEVWFRYVDDVFAIMKSSEVDTVLECLNSQYETIKFTVEVENNRKLPFLDLLLTRNNDGIEVDIFRKSTNTERYITSDSHTSSNIKHAAFNSMVYRMCRLPLSIEHFMKELSNIKHIATVNGYNETLIEKLVRKHSNAIRKQNLTTLERDVEQVKRIKCCFEPLVTNRLKSIFKKHNMQLVFSNQNKLQNLICNLKDKLPTNKKSGIYQVSCGDCSKVYLGQTRRDIHTRFKEHIAHTKYNRPTKSAIAAHILERGHLNINLENLTLIKQVNDPMQLDAWESLYIHKNKERTMNIDEEPIPSPLYKFCREKYK